MAKANDISETCALPLPVPLNQNPWGEGRREGMGGCRFGQRKRTGQQTGAASGASLWGSRCHLRLHSLGSCDSAQASQFRWKHPIPKARLHLNLRFYNMMKTLPGSEEGSPCPCTCTKPSSKQGQGSRRVCERLLLLSWAQDCAGGRRIKNTCCVRGIVR